MKSRFSTSVNKKKTGRFIKYALILVIIGLVYGWYQYSRYQYFLETPYDPTSSENVTFIIKQGENTGQIAKNLEEKDLIIDEGAFKLYTKLSGSERKIIAGRFILQSSMTIPEIVETITNTEKSEVVLTVPEGSMVEDIDKTLVKLGLIEAGDFNQSVKDFTDYEKYPFLNKEKMENLQYPLEGYLFPDTYFLDPLEFYNEDLIQLMLNNFETRLGDELYKENSADLNEIVIMASIVEKEVRTEEDIPVIAGILWKRLDSGWMLGADATLLYLADDREIDHMDLQEESPYNTRINAGLPPGPICNPGLKSIMGTIYPEESPYYFYLTTLDTGEVIYSVSNEEHNQNKQKYLH